MLMDNAITSFCKTTLPLLTYIIHMDVVNAGIAGVNICLSRQRKVLK